MPISTCFWLALRTLGRNRLRSALTLLGVTIGVAVVIAMVAIGTGARQSIEQHVKAAGTNQIPVVAGNYMRIADDFGSDVMEARARTGRRACRISGRFRTCRPPPPHHNRAEAARTGGQARAISPRVPRNGAATTLTVEDADAIAREMRGMRYRALE